MNWPVPAPTTIVGRLSSSMFCCSSCLLPRSGRDFLGPLRVSNKAGASAAFVHARHPGHTWNKQAVRPSLAFCLGVGSAGGRAPASGQRGDLAVRPRSPSPAACVLEKTGRLVQQACCLKGGRAGCAACMALWCPHPATTFRHHSSAGPRIIPSACPTLPGSWPRLQTKIRCREIGPVGDAMR